MSAQKFFRGDVVRISEELPVYMRHFPGAGLLALVIGSYRDLYGCEGDSVGTDEFELQVQGHGRVAWYPEKLLTLVLRPEKCPACGRNNGERS